MRNYLKKLLEFLGEQGVAGLAIGFLLGGAVSRVVTALINDILNPLVGIVIGLGGLKDAVLEVGAVKILWGDFLSTLIDFSVVVLVVYYGVKLIGLHNLKKDEDKK